MFFTKNIVLVNRLNTYRRRIILKDKAIFRHLTLALKGVFILKYFLYVFLIVRALWIICFWNCECVWSEATATKFMCKTEISWPWRFPTYLFGFHVIYSTPFNLLALLKDFFLSSIEIRKWLLNFVSGLSSRLHFRTCCMFGVCFCFWLFLCVWVPASASIRTAQRWSSRTIVIVYSAQRIE